MKTIFLSKNVAAEVFRSILVRKCFENFILFVLIKKLPMQVNVWCLKFSFQALWTKDQILRMKNVAHGWYEAKLKICEPQRCDPLINDMRMKCSLIFVSLNFNETFRSTGWREAAKNFFDFQRSFIYKVGVLEYVFYFFYIKDYAFIITTITDRNITPPDASIHMPPR